MKIKILSCILTFLSFTALNAQKQWWLDEPVRLLQTNLPMHLVPEYDPEQLVEEVIQSGANTWLFNVGGIYAYYPTKLDFQTINPYMEPNRDFAGELISLARKNNIRVIGRFDFSRFPSAVAKEHPNWTFRKPNGETIQFNDLVTACLFTDYYQEYAIKVVEEGMSQYNLDGILINWWGNHAVNSYIGVSNGVCHCETCKKKWAEVSDNPLPLEATPEYDVWQSKVKGELEHRIQKMVDQYNTNCALILYHQTGNRETLEGFTTETKTGPLTNEWWLYQSSYYVNMYRNSYPDKGEFNTVVNFLNMNYRFAPHRFMVNQTRMLQSMAHGTFPSFYMIGMPSQFDTTGAAAIYYPFEVHKKYEQYFVHQESVAEIVLIDDNLSENMRGMINILSESHIPFKIIMEDKFDEHLEDTRLFIAFGEIPRSLREAVIRGKNLLVIGNYPPCLVKDEVVGQISAKELLRSYWAINNSDIFPETSKRKFIYNTSDYTELKPDTSAPVLLSPPAMSAPPELAGNGITISNKPGLVIRKFGEGTLAYIPWNITAMYNEQASSSIELLLNELTDYLLEDSRQVITDAHPLVEISLMKNTDKNVLLLHMINNTGQLHGSHSQLIPLVDMNFNIRGEFKKVYTAEGTMLKSEIKNGYTNFTVKRLEAYELVVME
ncbi:MAG: beta-galactosidase [Bacteroidales bacterium]|nr:beta-galactosidase [Bacteroidales bacterium]